MRQPLHLPQRLEIGEFGEDVLRQHERVQVHERPAQTGRDRGDAVAAEVQRAQPRRERKVCEGGNVVVGKVERVLVAHDAEVF